MEKEKASRKRSTDKFESLPLPPPDPQPITIDDTPDALKRLQSYKMREESFLKTLKDTIDMETSAASQATKSKSKRVHLSGGANSPVFGDMANDRPQIDCETLTEECENYISPLLKRSGPSITAALVTQGAIDQLDKLHVILGQLLYMQEQNYKLRRNTRDIDTLIGLKKMQIQISKDPEEFLNSNLDLSDPEHDLELEYNESLLETILAAGKSATNKRNGSKKQRLRSKSVINDDINSNNSINNNNSNNNSNQDRDSKIYSFRRQSTMTGDVKSKVSKWTKVKAAFKWERANVAASLNEGKSTDSGIGLSPINHEVARYLRVPSIPCAGSSADSVLSSSSGHLLSGGSVPASPGTISSASSMEDIGAISEEFRNNRDSSKSESRCDSRTQDEEARRSRSLDGDATLLSSSFSRQLEKQTKNKTPWRKVKDIITTHRGSLKGKSRSRSVKPASSVGCSRDASPCDSTDAYSNIDTNHDRTESCSSSQTSPIRKTNPSLMLTAPPIIDASSCSNSPISPGVFFGRDDIDYKYDKTSKLANSSRSSSRKSKITLDIGCLPEGIPVDTIPSPSKGKPPPSPLNLSNRQESIDVDFLDYRTSPVMQYRSSTKFSRSKKQQNSSGPSSPSQLFEFFGEFESEDLSSGDFSEPCTPHFLLASKSTLAQQKDEINRKYHELQQQISLEFQAKRKEWERIRTLSTVAGCSSMLKSEFTATSGGLPRDDSGKDKKDILSKPIEENLTADFKKKLQEWRMKKQQSTTSSSTSPTKESDKKIDWHLWKTGQIKLEGQGLKQLPEEKSLPEDFQKKLDEWKRMKASGSIPTATTPAPQDTSVKRQSLKLTQIAKIDVTKKIKNAEDIDKELHKIERERQRLERERLKCLEREKLEKLNKLKNMIGELPAAKEVVVQTSKGVLKFEGISRKFTRKLYEWEKARGIGPESSTFALLHPGYRPLVVGNGEGEIENERGSPLARSLSMDSMSPNPSVLSISHQPSSLSLNNVDDLKGSGSITDRRLSSNPEFDLDITQDEPEAVIVEVEDDYVDTAASLFTASPMIEKQTPVYRYEQTRKEYCAGKKEAVYLGDSTTSIEKRNASKTLKDVSRLEFKDDERGYKANILHIQTVLQSLIGTFPALKANLKSDSSEEVDIVKDLAEEIIKMLDTLDESVMEKDEINKKMTSIDNHLAVLRRTLDILFTNSENRKKKSDDLPEINITPDDPTKNIAIINFTPVFEGEVIVNQATVVIDNHGTYIEDTTKEAPSECDNKNSFLDSNSNPDAKKIPQKPSNNGTKAKRKLRRLGSRQSSKTESDSDEDAPNIVLDAPRRVKRKTSKNKKSIELEKSEDTQNGTDDVVYVLKLKQGHKIEQAEMVSVPDLKVQTSERHILKSATDAPIENVTINTNIFVKTKRKIFSPVDNKTDTVIIRDLESSSASDRNDNEKVIPSTMTVEKLEETENKVLANLPPLPQSPGVPRRLEATKCASPKEPSPVIRFMIAKYNQRLSAERKPNSPQSSGSCSPTAWRSPVLDRRVRQQTERYLYQVTKSSSAGMVENQAKYSETNPTSQIHKELFKSPKSSSADSLAKIWPTESLNKTETETDITCRPPLACDSLNRIYHKKEIKDAIEMEDKHRRVNFTDENTSASNHRTGAVRKTSFKLLPEVEEKMEPSSKRCFTRNTLDRSSNTVPKIKRKYDASARPPSPATHRQSLKTALDLNIRNAALSGSVHSPGTPISDRALRIKKAKEEFLKQSSSRTCTCQDEEIWKNRTSQISIGSESSTDECAITKSASAGMIGADGHHLGGYVSLPRNTSKKADSQISGGRFGLSSIASKLKKVTLRKNPKELDKMNTVSRLCRQSLMVDISKEAKPINDIHPPVPVDSNRRRDIYKTTSQSNENLKKSDSVSGFGSLLFRRHERSERLKKSKSIGQLEESKHD